MANFNYKGSSLIKEPKGTKVTGADDVAREIRKLIGEGINAKEYFCTITLNGAGMVIKAEIIHIGTVNQSMVHPREVFRPAIVDGAAGIIIAHNHPSGSLQPSNADIRITERLAEAGKLLGIELLDHVLVTELGYYSFSDEGLV